MQNALFAMGLSFRRRKHKLALLPPPGAMLSYSKACRVNLFLQQIHPTPLIINPFRDPMHFSTPLIAGLRMP